MIRDPAVVLGHGGAVENDIVADRHAGAEHNGGEDHGARAQTSRRRARRVGMDEGRDREPRLAQLLEELRAAPERRVSDADEAGVEPLGARQRRQVGVAPEHERARLPPVGEAGDGPAARRGEVRDGTAVPAGAEDQEATAHPVLTCARARRARGPRGAGAPRAGSPTRCRCSPKA